MFLNKDLLSILFYFKSNFNNYFWNPVINNWWQNNFLIKYLHICIFLNQFWFFSKYKMTTIYYWNLRAILIMTVAKHANLPLADLISIFMCKTNIKVTATMKTKLLKFMWNAVCQGHICCFNLSFFSNFD